MSILGLTDSKYVKYIKNIRLISDHLVRTMDHLKVAPTCLHVTLTRPQIPKIDNTNIDRSIATIHSSILGCIRRFVNKGEPFWDKSTNTAAVVLEEYAEQTQICAWLDSQLFFRYERQSFVSSSRMLKYLESKALAKASLQDVEKNPESDEDLNVRSLR